MRLKMGWIAQSVFPPAQAPEVDFLEWLVESMNAAVLMAAARNLGQPQVAPWRAEGAPPPKAPPGTSQAPDPKAPAPGQAGQPPAKAAQAGQPPPKAEAAVPAQAGQPPAPKAEAAVPAQAGQPPAPRQRQQFQHRLDSLHQRQQLLRLHKLKVDKVVVCGPKTGAIGARTRPGKFSRTRPGRKLSSRRWKR